MIAFFSVSLLFCFYGLQDRALLEKFLLHDLLKTIRGINYMLGL